MGIKSGIEKNQKNWESVPENPSSVQLHIDKINTKNTEIEQIKKSLFQKYAEARLLVREKKQVIEVLEKRAVGIHADNPEMLKEYGIKKKLILNY